MAKFNFKMENILNIKYKLEDQAKIRYGNALAALQREEEILEGLKEQKENYQLSLTQLVNLQEGSLSLTAIRRMEDAVENMKYKISLQKVAVKKAESQVEVTRLLLDEAMKERKTYEKLKEKAFEQFKKDLEDQEKKEIDELVSFTFRPGSNEDKIQDLAI